MSVYSNVFIKNNKKWSYSFSSQFYSTTVTVTVRVTFSSRTYLGSPFSLQTLTPEICFGGSQFLSSSWFILLFSLDEVFCHLNWQALLRLSQLHFCTPPFWAPLSRAYAFLNFALSRTKDLAFQHLQYTYLKSFTLSQTLSRITRTTFLVPRTNFIQKSVHRSQPFRRFFINRTLKIEKYSIMEKKRFSGHLWVKLII